MVLEVGSLHFVPLLRSKGTRASTSFLSRYAEPTKSFLLCKNLRRSEDVLTVPKKNSPKLGLFFFGAGSRTRTYE
ncbi:MAG: hypothetical protein ABIS24_00060, partial [Candidatus Saccharimonadales bacterium]